MSESKKENIFEFIKKSKVSIIIIVLFALFAYGQRLISSGFSIDTELYINQLGTNVNSEWWIGLGRWGLVFLNNFIQLGTLPIFTNNFLTLVIIIAYSITYNYLFYTLIGEKYKKAFLKFQFIFPIIFITNPVFAEQYNFIIQNVGVAMAILMIPIAMSLINKAMEEENKVKKYSLYLIAIGMSVIGFGVYQSIILLYIATVVVCYLLKVISTNDNNWKYLFKQIGIFLIMAIGYLLISKILGEGNTYLKSAWGQDGILQCLTNIITCIKNVLYCDTIFYNIGYIVSLVVAVGIIIYLIVKKKMKIGIVIALVGLFLAPFYIMIITGVDQLKRTQFNYSFMIAVIMTLLVVFLAQKEKLKYLTVVALLISLEIAYMQSFNTASLFYTADVTYKADESFANELAKDIYEKEWYDENNEYKLIFVGEHLHNLKNTYLESEIIGRSFFEFDYQYLYGVNQRATAFLEILGYKFNTPTNEEFEEAKNYVEENDVPIYPKENSIQLVDTDKKNIRLSEEY